MDKPQSTRNRFSFLPKKEKRDKAIDTTLDVVDKSLKLLDGSVDFLPGAGAAVKALQLIVEQLRVSVRYSFSLSWDLTQCDIQKTRLNSKTAEELTKQIQDLIHLIDATIVDVKKRVESSKQATGLQEIDFGPDKFDRSGQITAIVEDLVKYVVVACKKFHAQTERRVCTGNWSRSQSRSAKSARGVRTSNYGVAVRLSHDSKR
jgi:hypothetical protein